ncbi:MAG: putative xylanase/chitin deacetylase, partial [Verrucomicrobiales bacterium]|nr:putative xylanase/chitin deacetylase [Verrucomicrobiales bacterium]
MRNAFSRREFIRGSVIAGTGLALAPNAFSVESGKPTEKKALVAISLDLEMARNFPNWEDSHWDYEKGNLSDNAKNYAVEAARRMKAAGGVIHFFLVASALEQEDVSWLQEIVKAGHSIGNHSYDHVNLLAQKPEDVQFKFKRAPWLIEGK